MTPYYCTRRRWQALQAEADSWLRTPFHHRQAVKGQGVDCVNLVQETLAETSYWTRQDLADYPVDFGSHSPDSVLLEAFRKLPAFRRAFHEIDLRPIDPSLRPSFIQPGDVVAILVGQCEHHAGLALPDRSLLHILRDTQGAGKLPLNTPAYLKRYTTIFRLIK
jgi:cell wall-associated NlpC family hydrolase